VFIEPDFSPSPDDCAAQSINSLQLADDEYAQIRDTDHLFEVLLDMFPRTSPHELREVWEKHRPNLEAAVCHVLALSEQQYPELPDDGSSSFHAPMEEDSIWVEAWPQLVQGNDNHNNLQQKQFCETSYRDRLLSGPYQANWDGVERDTTNDNASEASFGSVFSTTSSSAHSSNSQTYMSNDQTSYSPF
jgi:hypothetical protein